MHDTPEFPLDLEVEEIESSVRPGCGTSTTSPRCTCYPGVTAGDTTGA